MQADPRYELSTIEEEPSFFQIEPKLDCPHYAKFLSDSTLMETLANAMSSLKAAKSIQGSCSTCAEGAENWLCLGCADIFCSRYSKGHMVDHNTCTPTHQCALSFSDGSIWCYECDSYIHSTAIRHFVTAFGTIKFPESASSTLPFTKLMDESHRCARLELQWGQVAESSKDAGNHASRDNSVFGKVEGAMTDPAGEWEECEEEKKEVETFTREKLISGLSNRSYKKVVFLTGAGISVAAGIPDFRTPGIGLYSQVRKLGMDKPEEIFDLENFRENPQNFYSIGGSLLLQSARPVNAHRFIKKVEDEGMLLKCFTQNIDGLEIDAGLSVDKLVQAHGHMRSAACCNCKEPCSMELFNQHVETGEVLHCEKHDECGGFIKPAVTFFGEKLPGDFASNFGLIKEADLVVVMGTSLQVAPFSYLVTLTAQSTPLVLINRDNKIGDRPNFLFIQGDIEQHIQQICADVGWDL